VATHKSSEKRIRQTVKKTERNRAVRSKVKSAVRNLKEGAAAPQGKNLNELLRLTVKEISKAKSKGIINKFAASRYISRITKFVNKVLAQSK